jgi:hypothetical protein
MEFRKVFGNIEVELTGSLVQIKRDGETLKGEVYKAHEAMFQFNKTCKQVEEYLAKKVVNV